MFQPGVFAFGKKYRTSVLPAKCFNERISPSWSGKLKSSALSLADMEYLRRAIILHRAWFASACGALCLSMLCGSAMAQQRRQQKTPRALALVEWPAKGKPRVVPIAILIDGRFYDASIYMADPVPMALEYGNVYEVEKTGEPEGFVTINLPRQTASGQWTAEAKYQSKQEVLAATAKKAEPSVRPDPVEGPPKLTKGGAKAAAPAPTATPAPAKPEPAPTASGDDDRPRLTKPGETKPSEPTAAPSAAPASSAQAQPAQRPAEAPDTSGRPRLRRGVPVETSEESAPAPAVARASTETNGARSAQALAGSPVKILPAISDAGGPEPRSFVMPGSETPRDQLVSGMEDLARAALQKFAAGHGGANVGALENVDVRAFDLSLANQATVVLTASAHQAPAPPPTKSRRGKREPVESTPPVDAYLTYWVTVVARENYNGEMRQLQAWTTDSRHLDAYARMELIDAVDADGDGRGELLFRAINDLGRNFVIYRVAPDQLVSLYDSSQLSQ